MGMRQKEGVKPKKAPRWQRALQSRPTKKLQERPQGPPVPRAKVSLGPRVARQLKSLENPPTMEPVLGALEIAQELRQTA